jgi:Leucine-rich repeat (LRR) protein
MSAIILENDALFESTPDALVIALQNVDNESLTCADREAACRANGNAWAYCRNEIWNKHTALCAEELFKSLSKYINACGQKLTTQTLLQEAAKLYLWTEYGGDDIQVPRGIGLLRRLETLIFRGTIATETFKYVGELRGLKELNVEFCNLENLPEAFETLQSLTTLRVSGNEFKEFPNVVYKLAALETFIAAHCELTEFPIGMLKLLNLRTLVLHFNHISYVELISKALAQQASLTHLDLMGNKLTAFPIPLLQLTTLIDLNLSDNELDTVPELISNLSGLQYLNLRKNQISKIPKSLCKLTRLVELRLDNNYLSELPAHMIDTLTALKVLHVYLQENAHGIDLSHLDIHPTLKSKITP